MHPLHASQIAAGVYDELDDPSRDVVELLPFLDADMKEVAFDPEKLLLQPDGSLAGLLTSNWTIAEGESFVVRRQHL